MSKEKKVETKKVGGAATADAPVEKKERKSKRVEFPVKSAVGPDGQSIVDDKGKLLGIPATIKDAEGKVLNQGWDPKLFKPLKAKMFANESVFTKFRAQALKSRGERMVAAAEKLLKKAERNEKFGSDKTRRAADKLARLAEQRSKLVEQLKADGVDTAEIEALLGGNGKSED